MDGFDTLGTKGTALNDMSNHYFSLSLLSFLNYIHLKDDLKPPNADLV